MIKLTTSSKSDPIFRVFKKKILAVEEDSPSSARRKSAPPLPPPEKSKSWKWLVSIVFSVLCLLAICLTVFYINLSDKTRRNEIRAAEGVADVAMALTYAQINHINPLTQNWSNPEFLKNNFSAIVPPDYAFLANVDSHGKFTDCPYLLRIYTNNDFSNFLVIALPEPSLLQWLIPKNAILAHSQTMELRQIEDLRALNRLLVNPNTLDGANGAEITNLVKNSTLIPLSNLAAATNDLGFAPPKALVLRRPGAENLIHNAPRYYQFSETYVTRALNLTKSSDNSREELARLQQEMSNMLKLPNLILYSSEGIESAIEAEKAFATFIPFGKFLNGYVIFNSQGKISGSRLVMEEDYNKPAAVFLNGVRNRDLIAVNSNESHHKEETEHPIALQLLSLSSARAQNLTLIAQEINALLEEEIREYNPHFGEKLADLAIQFQQKNLEEKEKISKTLAALYEDYSDLPLAQILPHTKQAGLQYIVADMLLKQSETMTEENLSQELIGAQLQMIQKAKTFEELEESTTKAVNLLNLRLIPSSEHLIAYQNETRLLVIKKLEEFLLSSSFEMPKTEFRPENRNVLNHILEISWIQDPYEASFYLNEFDQLNQN